MLNTNGHNSSCAFQEEIVSYLYDEASVKEKTEFVAHLANCSGCSEELSAFGFVRSSIQEWRNEEIFSLEMPALEIPHLQPAKLAENSAVSDNSGAWLDRIRTFLTLSPKLAFGSAAFAVLAVCVGLGLFIFNSFNESDIASNSNRNSQDEFAANVNKTIKPNSSNPVIESQKAESLPENKPEQAQFKTPKNSTEKTAETPKDALKNKVSNRKPNGTMASTNIENKRDKTNTTQPQEAPKLSNLNEEEDNSLRLTDLFAEIGTE
ncbi:MAG: zf-HC2 domain-containing protein [Pyrinomonadaceae bacterium]